MPVTKLPLSDLQAAAWTVAKRESVSSEKTIEGYQFEVNALIEKITTEARIAAARYKDVLAAILAEHDYKGDLPDDTKLEKDGDYYYFAFGKEDVAPAQDQ